MRILLSVSLVFGMVGIVVAQPPGHGIGLGRAARANIPFLINQKSVQEELKLTTDQKAKVKAFLTDHRKVLRQAREGKLAIADPRRWVEELRQSSDKAVLVMLNSQQAKRLKQISIQKSQLQALHYPEVEEALQLTDEQKKQIHDIAREASEANRQLQKQNQSGTPESRKKLAEAHNKLEQKAMNVLTPQQVAKRKELLAKAERGEIGMSDVEDALELTTEQKKQMDAIEKESYALFLEHNKEYFREYREILTKAENQIIELFTDEQKAKWKEMKGDLFTGITGLGVPP